MQSPMQSDVDTAMTRDQSDGDQDSLFGSPPSSPGRSQSPALALPCASDTTQNVGTIALPGSHHYSKPPVNPLAPPLNYVARVPAQHGGPSTESTSQGTCLITSSSLPGSRASSAGFLTKSRKQQRKFKERTHRPPPPEIPLPDPSDPVPANFLRNQSALLGTAGLVGGVKPANLSVQHTRGISPSNPIVVEEETSSTRFSSRPHLDSTNPSTLPVSIEDIVSILVRQKDLFPVMASLLKLIATGSRSSQTSTYTSSHTQLATSTPSSSGPPLKKRKLTRVPAGAADWDVPYPFLPGQGPVSYRTTWERERGKQLISQLMNLIGTAIGKATARLHYPTKQQPSRLAGSSSSKVATEPKVCGHYRLITATYGPPGGSSAARNPHTPPITNNGLKTPTNNNSSSNQTMISESQPPATLDQLVASLLAATPRSILPDSANSIPLAANNVDISCLDDVAQKTTPASDFSIPQNFDQSMVESWIDILQTFPMSAEAFSQAYDPQLEAKSGASSSAGDEEFDFFAFDRNQPRSAQTDSASLSPKNITTPTDFDAIPHRSNSSEATLSVDTLPIDPMLLAISLSSQLNPATAAPVIENLPPFAPSPMPSFTSSGDTGPYTSITVPDVHKIPSGDRPIAPNCQALDPRQGDTAELRSVVGVDTSDRGRIRAYDLPVLNKGKGKAMTAHASEPLPPLSPTTARAGSGLPDLARHSTVTHQRRTTHVVRVNKSEVVRRAEERKKQLTAEINNVKAQLWETTIEQGILSHMNKYNRHVP